MRNLRLACLLTILLLTAVSLPGLAQDEPDNRAVHWTTYREALDTGGGQDKPILLHFTASYSSICSKMKRDTYQDRKVIRYLNEHFTMAMVDIEQIPSLGRKYQVDSLPTIWFLSAEGKPLTSIAGEVGPEKMLRVAEYVSKKIYEHTDYQTWLDKRSRR